MSQAIKEARSLTPVGNINIIRCVKERTLLKIKDYHKQVYRNSDT